MVLVDHSLQPRSSIRRREASEAAPTAGANYSARCHLEQETSGGPSGGHERLRAPSSIARTGTRQRARIDCYYYATAASEQTGLCHSNKLVLSQRRILLPFKNLNALALTPALVQQDKQQHQDQQQRQPLESTQMQQIEKVHKATSTPTATALTTTAIATTTTTSFTPTATATCAASAATTCALRATQAASGAAPGAINSHLSAHHHSDKLVSASIAFGHKTTRQAASARLLIPTFGHWTMPFALTLIFIVCLGDLIFASVSLISAGQQSSRRAHLAERVVARRADELAPRPAPVPSSSSSPSQSLQASEWAHNQRQAHDTQSADLARVRALASAQTVDGVDLRADESEPQIMAESRAAETQFGLRTRRLPTDHLHQSTKTNLALPSALPTAAVSSTKGRPSNQAAHIERGQLVEPLSYRQFGTTRASSIPALNRSAANQEDGQWIPIVRSSSAANNAQDSKASNHSGQAASMRSNTSAQMDNQYLDDSARSQSRPPIGERASAPRTSTRSQHTSIGRARQPLDGTESRIELYAASLGVQPRHQQLHESGHLAHRHNHHRQRLNNQLTNKPPHQYHFQRRPRLSTHHHQLDQANELGLGSFNAGKMYKRVLLCDKTLVSLDYVRYLEPEPRPFALGPIYKTTVASPSSPLHALDPTDSSNLIDEVLNDLGDNLIELDGQYSSLASKHAEAALNRSADAQPDRSPSSAGSLGRRERANSNEYRLPMVAQQPQQSGSSSRGLDGGAHFDASAPTRDANSTSSAPAADHSPLRLGAAESAVLEVRGSGSYLLNDQDPLVRCDMWDLEKGLKSRKPPEHLLRVAIKADFDTVRDAINRCRQLSEKTLPPEDEYRDGLEIMSTEDLISLFSIKRGLIPGTKWCGLGDQANSYNDLGPKHRIDICCRAHDHCPIRSKPFRNDYGVLNIGLYTKSHCDCDADFYRCLREVRSRAADMLGNLYFNVMKLQCMREERLKICREMKPIALGFERCIRYEDSPIKTVFKFTTPPVAY